MRKAAAVLIGTPWLIAGGALLYFRRRK